MKNSSNTIGNRTRDLPVCSALRHRVPQFPGVVDLLGLNGWTENVDKGETSDFVLLKYKNKP
jgi:hypothetical protein